MSVLFFPMWLLSGAFFPVAQTGWLAVLMRLNPLTCGVAGLRQAMVWPLSEPTLPSWSVCVAVTAIFAATCVALDVWMTNRSGRS